MSCPNGNAPAPGDHGLISWSYDPVGAVSASAATSGTVYLNAVQLRRPALLSTVWVHIGAAAVTPTVGQNFVGVIDSSGVQRGVTADVSASTTTPGVYGFSLTTPFSAAVGAYWVSFVFNAATPPQIARSTGIAASGALVNVNLPPARYRFATNGLLATSLPQAITPASNSTAGVLAFWVGVS